MDKQTWVRDDIEAELDAPEIDSVVETTSANIPWLFCYLDRYKARTRESAELRKLCEAVPIQHVPQGKRGNVVTKDFKPPYKAHGLAELDNRKLWAVEDREWIETPLRDLYGKHCVICDGSPPPSDLSLINPEVEDIKIGSVSVDSPTGEFICSYCQRQIRKQNARLQIPKVEEEVDDRGRIRGSEALSPAALLTELQDECPDTYSFLGKWMADETEENRRPGYLSLGDGNYWRRAEETS